MSDLAAAARGLLRRKAPADPGPSPASSWASPSSAGSRARSRARRIRIRVPGPAVMTSGATSPSPRARRGSASRVSSSRRRRSRGSPSRSRGSPAGRTRGTRAAGSRRGRRGHRHRRARRLRAHRGRLTTDESEDPERALDLARRAFLAGGPIHGVGFGLLMGALGLAGLRTGELPRPVAITALASVPPNLLGPLYLVAERPGGPSPRPLPGP